MAVLLHYDIVGQAKMGFEAVARAEPKMKLMARTGEHEMLADDGVIQQELLVRAAAIGNKRLTLAVNQQQLFVRRLTGMAETVAQILYLKQRVKHAGALHALADF